jgi:hypothetical protein
MADKARILVFGFTDAEQARIDKRLSEIGVPPPTRLQKRHGSVVIGDILREGAIGTEEFDCQERLVLFSDLSDAGVGSLMKVFKSLEIPKPIFAVVTETSVAWTLRQLMEHLIEEKQAHEGST